MGVGVRDELLVRDRVPRVQRRKPGQQPHGAPVGTDRVERRLAAPVLIRAGLPAREHERGGEPLQVPLPGAVQRLVEVVQIDDQAATRIAVQAEIGRVRVAADLGADPGHGGAGEVVRHEPRRTAQKREGRRRHPADPDRGELGKPAEVGLLDGGHGVGAAGVEIEKGVLTARHPPAQCLALLLGRPAAGPLGEAAHAGQPTRRGFRRRLRCHHGRLRRNSGTDLGHIDRLPRSRTTTDTNINSCRRYNRWPKRVRPCGQLRDSG